MGPATSHTATTWDALLQELRERGYVEGKNISFERRYSEGKAERLPALAAELVNLKVDVIVAPNTPATRAAQQATTTIPIVMIAGDPVGAGFVTSHARPGGNITGVSPIAELSDKWLELLREAVPKASQVAVLWNPTDQSNATMWRHTQAVADTLGVKLQSLEVRGPDDFESALATLHRKRVDGILVIPVPFRYVTAARLWTPLHRAGCQRYTDSGSSATLVGSSVMGRASRTHGDGSLSLSTRSSGAPDPPTSQ